MMRKLVIGLAKFCFGIFVTVLVGCLIAYFVSHNFMDYVDFYGPQEFVDKVLGFFGLTI